MFFVKYGFDNAFINLALKVCLLRVLRALVWVSLCLLVSACMMREA
jgi:hypothetical protein